MLRSVLDGSSLFLYSFKRGLKKKRNDNKKKEATSAWFEVREKSRMRCQKKQNGT